MRINFRPLFISALCLCLGVFAGFLYLKYKFEVAIISAAIIFSAFILIFIIHILKYKDSDTIKRKKYKVFYSFCAIFLAVMIMGFMLFYVGINKFEKDSELSGNATVKGIVYDSYKSSDGNYYMLLEKTTFNQNEKSYKIKGKVFVYVNEPYQANRLEIGQGITFTSTIDTNYIINDGYINTYAVRNSVNYTFFIENEQIEKIDLKASVFLKARKLVRETLAKNMREQNSDIAYALVLGDALHIESGLKNTFNDSGISHVFSVSGLHVSVLSVAIIFILKKFKLSPLLQLIISSVILFLYSAICGFVPSVTRSLFMVIIYLGAKTFGFKYDGITSVSAAVCLILIFSPLTLFDAGFLLSASAVYSIFLLRKPFTKLLRFLPKSLSETIAISLCAQIGLLPILFYFFNSLHLLSVLLNLIAVPIITAAYIILLVLIPLSALIPQLSFAYFLPQGLLEAVKFIVSLLDKTGLYTLTVKPLNIISTICFYLFLFFISNIVIAKKSIKRVAAIFLSVIVAVITSYSYIPFKADKNTFSAVNVDGINLSIVTLDDGSIIAIEYGTKIVDYKALEKYLFLNGIKNIDLFVSFAPNSAVFNTAKFFLKSYNLKNIALSYTISDPLFAAFENISPDVKVDFILSQTRYVYKTCIVSAYTYNNNYVGGMLSQGGVTALYLSSPTDKNLSFLINNVLLSVDLMFLNDLNLNYLTAYNPFSTVVNKKISTQYKGLHYLPTGGSLIFEIKNDKILSKYSY